MGGNELVGKVVVSQDGRVIGTVANVEVDLDSWQVPSLSVKLERDVLEPLGFEKPWLTTRTTDIRVALVKNVTDTVILNRDLSALQLTEPAEAK